MKHIISWLIILVAYIAADAMPLTVKQCREMALATDENITISRNNMLGADLDIGVAHTQYLPKFAASGNLLYTAPDYKFGDMMSTQIHGAYMAGINLTQPVYAGGKINAGNKMASVGKKISAEQMRATEMDVIADAEKSYWTYVAVLAKVEMTESYLSLIDSMYRVTQDAVEVGLQPQQALLRVNTRRSELEYRLKQAKAGADICRLALCRVIGVADTVSITPTEEMAADVELPQMGVGVDDRPETKILTHMIELKQHELAMTRGDFLPTVGVQLGWSTYGNIKVKGWMQDNDGNPFPFSTNIHSGGFMGILAAQIPLFHWGEGIKKIKRSKIEIENARLTLARNKRLMELQSQQAYSNLITGVELIKSADAAMAEAEENLRLMKEQYDVGLITMTDLLEAQSQWHSSYSNVIEARTQYRINRIDYLRAIGTL